MNAITQLLGEGAIRAIGWALLHSLWQGMIIALALAFVLLAMRRQSSNARYLAGLSALGLLFIAVVFTFFKIYSPGIGSQALSELSEAELLLRETGGALVASELPAAEQGIWQTLKYFGDYFEVHLPFIVLVWILGVFVLTLRMLGELAYIQHLRHSKGKFVTGKWHDRMQEIAWEMGIQHTVKLKESLRIDGPILTGYFKPIILIPFGLMANLTPAQVESVLAHELAHIKRHDYLINIVQSLVETILFFNPAMWWISSLIRTEREHSCDDLAINITGDEVTFVKTLAHLEEMRMTHANLALAFNGKGGVLGRIQRILSGKNSLELPLRIFWSTAVLVLFMGMMLVNIQHSTFAKNQLSNADNLSEEAYAELEEAEEMAALAELEASEEWQREYNPDYEADIPDYEVDIPSYQSTDLEDYVDTLPEDLRKLKVELEAMHKQFRQKAMEMEKQVRELEMQKLLKEKEVRKLQHEVQAKELEMQRNMQQLENQYANSEREQELKANEIRQQVLELEGQVAELREQQHLKELEEEDVPQEQLVQLEKQILALEKQQVQKQQAIRRQEIEQEKKMLEIEKQIQGIRNNGLTIERDMQMKAHEIEAAMLEIEHQAEEIEARREIMEAEIQMLIHEKEQQLHEAVERYEQRRKKEE